VAFLLGISQAQLATIKRRNSMPYSEILEFCKRENICSNEIFFD
jgi:L-rhamnose mutarotase